jgi:LysR family hydrogen peroxide-inducible transcriptional activator
VSRLPTTKQLRYFVALERLGHFGRAANACFVSQSAFSVAIRELETVLGTQLVDRTNKQVTVTSTGRRIADQARLCLGDLQQLVDMASESRKPLSGILTLGVIPTIAPFLLPKFLPQIRREYPDLKVYIHEGKTEEIYGRLMDGQLDLVLIALPYPLRSVETMPLFKDRFLLACRDKTELIDPDHFTINRVTADSVLLLEDGHCLRDHALEACHIRNLDAVNQFAASSLFTLIEMIDNDLGITFLPELAANSALVSRTRIKTYPMAKKSYREIALGWRKGTARSDEFRTLGTLIKNQSRAGRQQRSASSA